MFSVVSCFRVNTLDDLSILSNGKNTLRAQDNVLRISFRYLDVK